MNCSLRDFPAVRAAVVFGARESGSSKLRGLAFFGFVTLLGGVSSAVTAQTYGNFAADYAKLVSQASDVSMLDTQLFGDQQSLYTGGLSFSNTDVSSPGIGLPLSITRTYTVADRGSTAYLAAGAFGDWELELPRLYGVFAEFSDTSTVKRTGWNTQFTGYSRCSGPGDSYSASPAMVNQAGDMGGSFDATEYWLGNTFVAPGGGRQELMIKSTTNPNQPQPGAPFRWVTNDQWFFSCIPVANGYPGEGFLARGPDGTEIALDHMAKRPYPALSRRYGFPSGARPVSEFVILPREEVSLLPSKIKDRFGNVVEFIYDPAVPGRLLQLKASDLRILTLSYDANGRIWKISDGTREWKYFYSASGSLTQVTLSDQSKWTYSFEPLTQYQAQNPHSIENDVCNNAPPINTGNAQGIVTHPSGAVGTFTIDSKRHARSHVQKMCVQDSAGDMSNPDDNSVHAMYPRTIQTPTIASKQVSGIGVATPMLWTYAYDSGNTGSWDTCGPSCPATTWTQVRGPGGLQQIFTFGNRFRTDEGRLYRTQTSQVTVSGTTETVTLLSDEQTSFVTSSAGQAFPASVGDIIHSRGDWMAAVINPVQQTVLTQQGVNFSRTNNSFDQFANPKSVTRSSSGSAGGNFSRTEDTEYFHDLNKWVLGQVKSVKVGSKFVSRTVFDAAVLPKDSYSFEALQQTLAYNANGTVASVTDGRGKVTKVEGWHRGTPQKVTFADTRYVEGVVDDFGLLRSATNELGAQTSYRYDDLGRLELITYPVGDSVAWNPTIRDFTPVVTGDDRPVGHWKQLVATGNAQATTYYDALWRPVLIRTEDTTVAGSRSYVVKRYDAAGRLALTGYPVATIGEANASNLKGVSTQYDALGRVTSVGQDSELGVLTSTSEYLTKFQIRTTNPRGNATTTSYQVFDTPDTSRPVKIEAPEGVTTTITRDTFGKPLKVTRSGPAG